MYSRANPPSTFTCFFIAFLFITLLSIYSYLNHDSHFAQIPPTDDLIQFENITNVTSKSIVKNLSADPNELKTINVKTYKGYISLKELNEEVYHPFGYEITRTTLPVPRIRMKKELTCEETFSEWIRVAQLEQPKVPPMQMPIVNADDYLMNNYAGLSWGYMNNNTHNEKKPSNWHRFAELMSFQKTILSNLEYGVEADSMFHALSAHRQDVKNGLIIGSMQPWLETMALQNGAAKLLIMEHYKLEIPAEFQDRVSDIRPMELAKNWQKYAETFDFAASFSNIQHMGLGRFGDPIDAWGDLKEILKIRCLLKPGGLLFLGVPLGTDAVLYNVQRIYGPLRLSMVTAGYEWLETFSHSSFSPIELTTKVLHKDLFKSQHYTLVLKKL